MTNIDFTQNLGSRKILKCQHCEGRGLEMMKIGVSLRYYIFEPPISISVCDFFLLLKTIVHKKKRVEFFFHLYHSVCNRWH